MIQSISSAVGFLWNRLGGGGGGRRGDVLPDEVSNRCVHNSSKLPAVLVLSGEDLRKFVMDGIRFNLCLRCLSKTQIILCGYWPHEIDCRKSGTFPTYKVSSWPCHACICPTFRRLDACTSEVKIKSSISLYTKSRFSTWTNIFNIGLVTYHCISWPQLALLSLKVENYGMTYRRHFQLIGGGGIHFSKKKLKLYLLNRIDNSLMGRACTGHFCLSFLILRGGRVWRGWFISLTRILILLESLGRSIFGSPAR